MVAPQQENAGRARIMATARALFDTHGFHQTSMAELAASAQVSVGQIYRLFKGKEDIINALVRDDADGWCDEMTVLRDRLDAGEMTIEQTFEELMLHTMEEKQEALSFDILAESFRNPAVAATIGDMCARGRAYIRHFACAANPALSGEALDAAEEIVLACLFGLGHRSLSRPKLDAPRAARWSARMVVVALRDQ
jgi:TetR/AcrR family transcriptional repressor of uid operon